MDGDFWKIMEIFAFPCSFFALLLEQSVKAPIMHTSETKMWVIQEWSQWNTHLLILIPITFEPRMIKVTRTKSYMCLFAFEFSDKEHRWAQPQRKVMYHQKRRHYWFSSAVFAPFATIKYGFGATAILTLSWNWPALYKGLQRFQ